MKFKVLLALFISILAAQTVQANDSCEPVFVHTIEPDFPGVDLPALYQVFKINFDVTVSEVPESKMPTANKRDMGLYLLKKKQVYIAKAYRPITKHLVANHELVHVRYFDRFQKFPDSIENFMGTSLIAGGKNKFNGTLQQYYPDSFKLEEVLAYASDIKNSFNILKSKKLIHAPDIQEVQIYYQTSIEVFDALVETSLGSLKATRSYIYDRIRSKEPLDIKMIPHFNEKPDFWIMEMTIKDQHGEPMILLEIPIYDPAFSKNRTIENLEAKLIKNLDYAIKRIILTQVDIKSYRIQ